MSVETQIAGINLTLGIIFILLWYYLAGIRDGLHRIANELEKQDNTKAIK